MTTHGIQRDSGLTPSRSRSHTSRADDLIIHVDRMEWDGFAGVICLGHLEASKGAAKPADSRTNERLLGTICEPMN